MALGRPTPLGPCATAMRRTPMPASAPIPEPIRTSPSVVRAGCTMPSLGQAPRAACQWLARRSQEIAVIVGVGEEGLAVVASAHIVIGSAFGHLHPGRLAGHGIPPGRDVKRVFCLIM